MKLEDFMTTVLSKTSSEAHTMFGLSQIKQIANRVYKANCASPDFTKVRFDSSLVRTEQYRTTNFNLLVRLTPKHPYFRSWLKPAEMRCTELLYLFKLGNGAPQYSSCKQPVDAEIRSIVDTIEKRIIDKVTEFEACIHTLNRITDHYGLQSKDMSDLLTATDYLVKYAKLKREFYLDRESRNTLLPE